MSNEVKLSLIWGTVIIVVILSISVPIAWYYQTTTKAAFENGYSEQTLPGKVGAYWVKTKE